MKVSVIVPIYNIEGFIEKCAMSLMKQTLDDVEYIFVDDASTDKSLSILKNVLAGFPAKMESIHIIQHRKNMGLPSARNSGLEIASGEFIMHCDGDDFIEASMLEQMYACAIENNADFVWCDYYLSFADNERYMPQPSFSSSREALSATLAGTLKYNVWNKLVKRSLYAGLKFPVGRSMGEDMTMIKLLARAKKVYHINEPFYHYIRYNIGALTKSYSASRLEELQKNTEDIISFLKNAIQDTAIETEISWFKLNVKLPFLFTGEKEDLDRWKEWYPEANRFILSNQNLPIRTRLLQYCASIGMTFINKIYVKLLFKLMYGKIYK